MHETLLDAAGVVVRLDSELAARGCTRRSTRGARARSGEEALVGRGPARPLEALRGVMRSLDPVEAWEFVAQQAREAI